MVAGTRVILIFDKLSTDLSQLFALRRQLAVFFGRLLLLFIDKTLHVRELSLLLLLLLANFFQLKTALFLLPGHLRTELGYLLLLLMQETVPFRVVLYLGFDEGLHLNQSPVVPLLLFADKSLHASHARTEFGHLLLLLMQQAVPFRVVLPL